MKGHIHPRGPATWQLKFDIGRDPDTGQRRVRYETVRGVKRDAQTRLNEILADIGKPEYVDRSGRLLSEWVKAWLALREGKIGARTLERYAQLLQLHVVPTLGARPLQKIKAAEVDALYSMLSKSLSARTVHHVHVVLGTCINAAIRKGELRANPLDRVDPPAAGDSDVGQALEQEELAALLNGFRNSTMLPIVATAAFTGARRNEILALRWSDIDLVGKAIRIERSLEETKAHGLRYKDPKTKRGTRTIAIDDGLIELLRAEREKYLRLVAGVDGAAVVDLSLVKLPENALAFPSPGAIVGSLNLAAPRDGRSVTKEFRRRVKKLGFPTLRFHDLRGTHETMLLDAGVPVHVVAARCGHDPAVLLRVYARRTKKADTSAAAIIGALSKAVLKG